MKHRLIVLGVVVVGLAGMLLTASAQEKSVKPGINKGFVNPDVKDYLKKFEGESREVAANVKAIVAACHLKPGMVVADVGAGTGLFTRRFAAEVGDKGKVFAVDISSNFLRHIQTMCDEAKIKNVETILCDQFSTKLPKNSVDLVFICDTYHHFEFPQRTLQTIHDALRPGGKIVLIDFQRVEGKSSEWILGHVRAGKDVFVREIVAAGFKVIGEEEFLKENYFVRFEKGKAVEESNVTKDKDGFLVHEIESPYQKGKTNVYVLTPDRMESGKTYPVIYVLPVQPGNDARWGNGLVEIQKLDLHNKWGVIFVMPTFSDWPWYCDHPSDPLIRQETYVLEVVVPMIEKSYPVSRGTAGRLLLGFSKSGWGAFSLLLRHPEVFGRAAAWDAPLNMTAPNQFGMGPIFGTQENFEKYRISSLLRQRAETLTADRRLAMIGYSNFRAHHQAIHEQMTQLRIPHDYADVRQGQHDWRSGWLDDAVKFLVAK